MRTVYLAILLFLLAFGTLAFFLWQSEKLIMNPALGCLTMTVFFALLGSGNWVLRQRKINSPENAQAIGQTQEPPTNKIARRVNTITSARNYYVIVLIIIAITIAIFQVISRASKWQITSESDELVTEQGSEIEFCSNSSIVFNRVPSNSNSPSLNSYA